MGRRVPALGPHCRRLEGVIAYKAYTKQPIVLKQNHYLPSILDKIIKVGIEKYIRLEIYFKHSTKKRRNKIYNAYFEKLVGDFKQFYIEKKITENITRGIYEIALLKNIIKCKCIMAKCNNLATLFPYKGACVLVPKGILSKNNFYHNYSHLVFDYSLVG